MSSEQDSPQSEEIRYDEMIDAETWAFIGESERYYPADAIDVSIQEQRQVYDALCGAFHKGHPDGVRSEDSVIKVEGREIPMRKYWPSNPSPQAKIIYYHGGGFVVGGLESHDDVCAELCEQTGFEVVSVDYRLSPENPFPACFDDALESFLFIASETNMPIILAGDSAGGNLAAAVSDATKNKILKPTGQVLIYPALGDRTDFGSYIRHQNAPMLTKKDVDFYHHIRTDGVSSKADPRLAPLTAKNVSTIPPTVIFSAEIDPLCDDGELYVQRLREAGVKAEWVCETGLVHGYLRARHSVDRARRSFSRIVDAIRQLGNGTEEQPA